MRIAGGDEPLDATGVHPESYGDKGVLKSTEVPLRHLSVIRHQTLSAVTGKSFLRKSVSERFLKDIVKRAVGKPARDPREDMPLPVLRTDVLDMKDLKEGMILKGTVRNVIDSALLWISVCIRTVLCISQR